MSTNKKPTPVKRTTSAGTGRLLMRAMSMTTARAVAACNPRIEAIHSAREAAEIVLAELLHRSETVITADDMAGLQPEIELARGIVNDCRQKEIDLTAAGTTVLPLDPALTAKLQSLVNSIDTATVRQAVINAALNGLASILNSAIRIQRLREKWRLGDEIGHFNWFSQHAGLLLGGPALVLVEGFPSAMGDLEPQHPSYIYFPGRR